MMHLSPRTTVRLLALVSLVWLNAAAGQAQTGTSTGNYSMLASPVSTAPQSTITVQWQAPAKNSTEDWIGLFLVGHKDSGSSIITWKYVPAGASGIMSFQAPNVMIPHTYERDACQGLYSFLLAFRLSPNNQLYGFDVFEVRSALNLWSRVGSCCTNLSISSRFPVLHR